MKILRVVLGIICAILWAGWYYLVALACGFGHGHPCAPFQGSLDATIMMVWAPLFIIAILYSLLWLIESWRNR